MINFACMMVDRLLQLYEQLGLNKENGLFFLDESHLWISRFPYRVSRILKEVIKPDAFFCLYSEDHSVEVNDHPKPFNQSFILFFDNPDSEREKLIHKQVINFGLAQAIFINRNDTFDLFHGNDFSMSDIKRLIKLDGSQIKNFSFINQIRGNVFKTLGEKQNTIDKFLLKNITDARRILVAKDGLNLLPKAANRLIGRLLFISYLIDRDVTFNDQEYITGKNKIERKNTFRNLITNKDQLYNFFRYLTNKYNGDMFPLIEKDKEVVTYKEEDFVTSKHLEVLSHLFNCSSFFAGGKKFNANYVVQRSLFDLYDFEIIPVELISSIYENFIGNIEENENLNLSKQKDIKAYYTPPYLVDYVLSQTVTPFLQNKTKTDTNCKVLDPACGSGIFLVETIRKIVEKELSLTNNKKITDNRLWKLIKSNIFGIDIDPDAIDISIFSLYITILDYKQPAEIENFRFQKLKDENFFGGQDADFFNLAHPFNKIINDLDFVIGNPPWGRVPNSNYIEYIQNRNEFENRGKSKADKLLLQIGDKEICQAFLVRTSDFASESKSPICSLIVSSKVFYNSEKTSKSFRNYFLLKFHIKQVVELSPVNNKIRGGSHIFENAKYPAAIVTFIPEVNNKITSDNVIQHITVKPNIFFLFYKTILIEKHDVKRVKQEYFIERLGGFDWLWKTLVFGNALDIHFVKKLKDKKHFKTGKQHFNELGYHYNGGLKEKDGLIMKDASPIIDFAFLDADKEFRPFIALPSKSLKKHLESKRVTDNNVGYLPKSEYFEGSKLLFKKGVVLKPRTGEFHFGAVSAYNEGKICFTSTVASLIPINKDINSREFLSSLSALFNSKLFTYFVLNTGPSLGVEKSRINFDEFEQFPVVLNNKLGELALSLTNVIDFSDKQSKIKQEIDKLIFEIYQISETEAALIDYAMSVSIPVLLRESNSSIFKPLNFIIPKDKDFITNYITVFRESLRVRFERINKSLKAEILYSFDFVRINFHLVPLPYDQEAISPQNRENEDLLGDLGIYKVCKNLYFQQDVRGFSPTSFYIVKPNERKLWHHAVAYLDAMEFEEEITKAEINHLKFSRSNERS